MKPESEKPDYYAVIRGKRQKIIKLYKTKFDADYYARAESNLLGWAKYQTCPVKLVFLDDEDKSNGEE